jgi:hypothetical protein
LRLFFVLLVVVPMIALALVVFILTSRSETGKADAGISAGAHTAFGLYEEAAAQAEPALRDVASDPALKAALAAGRPVDARLEQLVGGGSGIESIEFHSPDGRLEARAGPETAVAPRAAPLHIGSETVGTLAVSVTDAGAFANRVKQLTGLEVAVYRDGSLLGATMDGLGDREQLGPLRDPRDFEFAGRDYPRRRHRRCARMGERRHGDIGAGADRRRSGVLRGRQHQDHARALRRLHHGGA